MQPYHVFCNGISERIKEKRWVSPEVVKDGTRNKSVFFGKLSERRAKESPALARPFNIAVSFWLLQVHVSNRGNAYLICFTQQWIIQDLHSAIDQHEPAVGFASHKVSKASNYIDLANSILPLCKQRPISNNRTNTSSRYDALRTSFYYLLGQLVTMQHLHMATSRHNGAAKRTLAIHSGRVLHHYPSKWAFFCRLYNQLGNRVDLRPATTHYIHPLFQDDAHYQGGLSITSSLGPFLMPKEFRDFMLAAQYGPIIILNAINGKNTCDALILNSPSDLRTIQLKCSFETLNKMQSVLHQTIGGKIFREGGHDMGDTRAFGPTMADIPWLTGQLPTCNEICQGILNYLWLCVVRPCLARLCSNRNHIEQGKLTHIRWFCNGPFRFLPIHAAGIYAGDGTTMGCITDGYISSYIPSLKTLLESNGESSNRDSCSMPCQPDKMLAVIQPNTPSSHPLPGTLQELSFLQNHTNRPGININLKTLLRGEATVTAVLEELARHPVAHFACHGMQDHRDPKKSGLLLSDGRLDVSSLAKVKFQNAQLVFLSACETAMGESVLTDSRESVHLAAGMLTAGFKNVVATMWSISDKAAPIAANEFYGRLIEDGLLRSDKAAEALHYAVQHLRRQSRGDFMSWLPFIHLG